MVPPLYVGQNGAAIKRTGPQKTYVFFEDGVETFVIRPGYSGNIDEFGMLVPFPSPPAIRKVPDEIFEQIAAAVDPPEVVIDLKPRPPPRPSKSAGRSRSMEKSGDKDGGLRFDEVRVLSQEAVGMYEVAVLEAGSSNALRKWMEEHKFKYPTGMDEVCDDYVAKRWCFVAVKTRVADKAATDPKPGMKQKPDSKLPAGAVFNGHVQGMGYRFLTPEPVLPMRLATYNEADDRRQVVYLLSNAPRTVAGTPNDLVKRQIPGKKLRSHVVDPLPLRIYGGNYADVPVARLKALAARRNPLPHNGAAKELFTSDLLAAKTKSLSLDHEEEEKELLRIGERLLLRGPEIDALHTATLQEARTRVSERTVPALEKMTLTVIDGQFPLDLMRDQDLTFKTFVLAKEKNTAELYDARVLGPGGAKVGIRVDGDGTVSGKQAMNPGWNYGWDE